MVTKEVTKQMVVKEVSLKEWSQILFQRQLLFGKYFVKVAYGEPETYEEPLKTGKF